MEFPAMSALVTIGTKFFFTCGGGTFTPPFYFSARIRGGILSLPACPFLLMRSLGGTWEYIKTGSTTAQHHLINCSTTVQQLLHSFTTTAQQLLNNSSITAQQLLNNCLTRPSMPVIMEAEIANPNPKSAFISYSCISEQQHACL